jgi:serine/threonine protein kinase
MVFGVNPFDGNNDDEILKKVHNAEYTFPKNIEISKTCKTIITKLLDKKPKQRIDLFDDLFDVWYEENSSDVVIKKQAEEELFKINKDPQQRNSMNNVGAIKETSGKPVTNSSSGIKNKDSNIKNSVFSKKVSNFRIEPKSENSKNKDSDSNSLLIKKFDMKKVEKKK